jgi:hypothetical protein
VLASHNWYDGPNAASNAIGYASQYSRSHDAVIRVYDEAGNVIETHDVQRGENRPQKLFLQLEIRIGSYVGRC